MQLYTPVTALMFLHKESIDCIISFWPYQVECTLANNGKPKEKQQYYLPTFDTTVETKCFPSICYLDDVEPGLEPYPKCLLWLSNLHKDKYKYCCKTGLLSLFPSILLYLPSPDCCPICLVPLKKKVQKLANTFNNSLLTSKDPDSVENNKNIHD